MSTKPDCYILPQQRRNEGEDAATVKIVAGEDKKEERRQRDDRRGLHSNISLSSDDTMTKIVAWLYQNCNGEWYIGTASEKTGNKEALCRVRFDEEADLSKFQEWVSAEAQASAGS